MEICKDANTDSLCRSWLWFHKMLFLVAQPALKVPTPSGSQSLFLFCTSVILLLCCHTPLGSRWKTNQTLLFLVGMILLIIPLNRDKAHVIGGELWHEGGNTSLGVGLDVGGIIFHQLCAGGRVLWNCTVSGKVCHCKPHHVLLDSGACNPVPWNYCIGMSCLAVPKSILPNLRNWTLDPLLLYVLSVNSRIHGLPDASQYSCCFCWAHTITSSGSNGASAMATVGSPLPRRVAAQLQTLPMPKFLQKASHCDKQRTCVGSETETQACRSRWAHGRDFCLQWWPVESKGLGQTFLHRSLMHVTQHLPMLQGGLYRTQRDISQEQCNTRGRDTSGEEGTS